MPRLVQKVQDAKTSPPIVPRPKGCDSTRPQVNEGLSAPTRRTKNHYTIAPAPLGIEPNMSQMPPQTLPTPEGGKRCLKLNLHSSRRSIRVPYLLFQQGEFLMIGLGYSYRPSTHKARSGYGRVLRGRYYLL